MVTRKRDSVTLYYIVCLFIVIFDVHVKRENSRSNRRSHDVLPIAVTVFAGIRVWKYSLYVAGFLRKTAAWFCNKQ